MGICTICGKKGLFLKINSMGMCISCSLEHEKAEEEKKTIAIQSCKRVFQQA